MGLKTKIGFLSILLAASLVAQYFLKKNLISFQVFANLATENITEKDYLGLVHLHNRCFEEDKRKNLYLYFSEVKYREAAKDLRGLIKQQVEQFVEKHRMDKIKTFRDTENVAVMKRGEEVLGFYNCHDEDLITDGNTMIYNLCVAPKMRKQGYGGRLVQHAIQHCSKPNKGLTLTVYKDNQDAIRLYEKFDFKIIESNKLTEENFNMFNKHLMKL